MKKVIAIDTLITMLLIVGALVIGIAIGQDHKAYQARQSAIKDYMASCEPMGNAQGMRWLECPDVRSNFK